MSGNTFALRFPKKTEIFKVWNVKTNFGDFKPAVKELKKSLS
jgi:hypothetical protein